MNWKHSPVAVLEAFTRSTKRPINRTVLQFLRRESGPLALACSGGIDSLALLLYFWAADEFRDRILVLHYDHKTRQESSADAEFVIQLATQLGLPWHCEKRQWTAEKKLSENFLRQQRFEFFHRIMAQEKSHCLLTAHQQEDIFETILWRLSRGSGLEGLTAPRPIQEAGHQFFHIRPFLNYPKKQLRNFLERLNLCWCEDISNGSNDYARNRIRNELLPHWEQLERGRNLGQSLLRTHRLLSEDWDLLRNLESLAWSQIHRDETMNSKEFRGLHRALQRRVLLRFLNYHRLALRGPALDQVLDEIAQKNVVKISLDRNHWLVIDSQYVRIVASLTP